MGCTGSTCQLEPTIDITSGVSSADMIYRHPLILIEPIPPTLESEITEYRKMKVLYDYEQLFIEECVLTGLHHIKNVKGIKTVNFGYMSLE